MGKLFQRLKSLLNKTRNFIYYVCFIIVFPSMLIHLLNMARIASGDFSATYSKLGAYADLIGSPIPMLLRLLIPIRGFYLMILVVSSLILLRRACLLIFSKSNKIPIAYSGFFYAVLFIAFYGTVLVYLKTIAEVAIGLHGIGRFIYHREIFVIIAAMTLAPTLISIEIVSLWKNDHRASEYPK